MGKILRISLKLNFTPNTLGCYGLIYNSDICSNILFKKILKKEQQLIARKKDESIELFFQIKIIVLL